MHLFMLPVQFLDTFLDMLVVVLRQVPGSMVQKTVDAPQLQSIAGRRHSLLFRRGRSPWSSLFSRPQRFLYCCSSSGRCPCYEGRAVSPVAENCGNSAVAVHHGRRHLFRCAEAVPLGPDYSVDHRDFTDVRIWWSMFLFAGSFLVVVLRQIPWSRLSVGPFSSPVNTVADVPVVQVQQQVREAQTLQKTIEFPQLLIIKFVDIPFVPQTQILMVQTFQQTTEFPQLQYFSGGRCPC